MLSLGHVSSLYTQPTMPAAAAAVAFRQPPMLSAAFCMVKPMHLHLGWCRRDATQQQYAMTTGHGRHPGRLSDARALSLSMVRALTGHVAACTGTDHMLVRHLDFLSGAGLDGSLRAHSWHTPH